MENEENLSSPKTPKRGNKLVGFLADILRGVLIGIAFIIPGFSGGSIMAILGIYEKFVGAVADIFKDFKRSFMIILPIAIGLVLGACALMFPLSLALEHFPIPTVALFVGLALGGMPSITEKVPGKPKVFNLVSFLIPCAVAVALCFLPVAGDVDLFNLNFGGYILLFIIGLVGSAALVVPGISGSMILLILGYYNPILQMITGHLFRFQNLGKCFAVLGITAAGILIGFFLISVLMKFLLKKYPRNTYYAIIGFIIGSIPTVFVSTTKDAGQAFLALMPTPWHWVVSVVLLVAGFIGAYAFVRYARKHVKSEGENAVVVTVVEPQEEPQQDTDKK